MRRKRKAPARSPSPKIAATVLLAQGKGMVGKQGTTAREQRVRQHMRGGKVVRAYTRLSPEAKSLLAFYRSLKARPWLGTAKAARAFMHGPGGVLPPSAMRRPRKRRW